MGMKHNYSCGSLAAAEQLLVARRPLGLRQCRRLAARTGVAPPPRKRPRETRGDLWTPCVRRRSRCVASSICASLTVAPLDA